MTEPHQYCRVKMNLIGKSMLLFLEEDACMRMCARVYVRNEWTDLSGEPHSTAKKKSATKTLFMLHTAPTHTQTGEKRKTQKLRKHRKRYRQKKSLKSLHTFLCESTALNNLISKHSNKFTHALK